MQHSVLAVYTVSVSNIDMPEPIPYKDVLAANVRAARARADISQAACAARMKNLGFTHVYGATIGAIERGERVLGAVEVAGLSLCLGTTVSALMLAPLEAGPSVVVFPNGERVPAQRLAIVDDSVSWNGDDIKIAPPTEIYRPADLLATMHAVQEQLRRAAAGEPQPGPQPGDLDAEDLPPGWRSEGEDQEGD